MKTQFTSLAPLSILAGALILSSCGGGNNNGPSTTAGTTTAGTTTAGTTTAGTTTAGGTTAGTTTAGTTTAGTTTAGGTTAGSTTAGTTTAGTTAGNTTSGGTTAGGGSSLSGQIAFVSTREGNSDIYAMDASGNNQRALSALNSDSEERSPSISRDGSTIVWSSNRPNQSPTPNFEIYIQRSNGAGGQVIQAYTNDTDGFAPEDTEPVISPDGTKIAWTTTRGGDKNIAVMNINGDNQVVLTTANAGEDSQPAWTSDSQSIAFYSERGDSRGIYLMDASGGNQRALLVGDDASGVRYLQPAYSPDGQRLAVAIETGGITNISLRNLDGTQSSDNFNAGSGFSFRSQANFSSDSNRLIYLANNSSDGGGQIQTSALDGSGERSLTSSGQNFDARFSN